ncbi:glycosyltransferase family 22 protein [Serendipita vermifera MAFF 305830]|uniref:Mannosyltransferase n=1 Tax=Serendipita vermifera MAFF 305830 TaxID=933852 RepID=A0A0C3BLD2_SERVB|nr:glycosyltransferase family 22 protein [Serendipita vermifera MAFF 305830]
MLVLVRFCAAMYSNISDCDEVYNFWEPLHYIFKGYGFQTWEVSPEYAIRSWAYIFLHYPFVIIGQLLSDRKRTAFFTVRAALGLISTLCEARLFRSVAESVSERVGIYLLIMLMTSAGMWSASTAFLPSTFAMYCNMLAFSFAVQPARSRTPNPSDARTLFATVIFGAGAIVGWPFSILASFPFVFEELFVRSGDKVAENAVGKWIADRWIRMVGCVFLTAFLFIPVIGIDSIAYGRFTSTTWNIISYNLFGGAERGPDLYGTEPWHFYLLNLILNFNALLPLALFSLPALLITHAVDYTRLGSRKHTEQESSPYFVLSIRLAPFYLWLLVLSLQAHKEERFMFPVYPLLCFNAAVTLYLMRGWLDAFFTKTVSQYAASQSSSMRILTLNVLLGSGVISFLRIAALFKYYHAPMDVAFHFEHTELPRLLNATGLLPPLPPIRNKRYDNEPRADMKLVRQFGLRLCIGKEWYRFPSHFFVPDGIDVKFIKSEFDGLLPQPFPPSVGSSAFWPWDGMRVVPEGLNDLNIENSAHYGDVSDCDYLFDLDFPTNPRSSAVEQRFAPQKGIWDTVHCEQFLDAANSPTLSRILWIPGRSWWTKNEYGNYCMLRNRKRAARRENEVGILYS